MAHFKYEEKLVQDSLYQNLAIVMNKSEMTAERKGRGVWKKPTWREKYQSRTTTIINKLATKKQSWLDWFVTKFTRTKK